MSRFELCVHTCAGRKDVKDSERACKHALGISYTMHYV